MCPRLFTDHQEAAIVARYAEGVPQTWLIQEFGGSSVSISNVLKRHGVPRRPRPGSAWFGGADQKEDVLRRYAAGQSVRDIARALKCRTAHVSDTLHAAGVTVRLGGVHKRFTDEEAARLTVEYQAGASLRSLAEKHDSNTITVRNTLRRQGVETRERTRPPFWTPERVQWSADQYRAGRSQQAIADELGVSQNALSRQLIAAGVVARVQRRRERHHGWKGGRFIASGGYVYVAPTDDDLRFSQPNTSGYVPEHRLVMGRLLGRRLDRHETVHHINGDKTDNRPGNLQLRQGKHGTGVVHRCLDCGSTNVAAVPLS